MKRALRRSKYGGGRSSVASSRRVFLTRTVAAVAGMTCGGRTVAKATSEPVSEKRFDLDFLACTVPLMRRECWAPDPPRPALLREGGVYDRITIHHQGGRPSVTRAKNAVVAEIDAIYGGHRRHRYGDIAYHFIVDYAGRVWEGRSLAYKGAHVSSENERNLGIVVLGNYEQQSPSRESVATLATMVSCLRKRFHVPRDCVYGHRDIGASICPGRTLYPHVVALRKSDTSAASPSV